MGARHGEDRGGSEGRGGEGMDARLPELASIESCVSPRPSRSSDCLRASAARRISTATLATRESSRLFLALHVASSTASLITSRRMRRALAASCRRRRASLAAPLAVAAAETIAEPSPPAAGCPAVS